MSIKKRVDEIDIIRGFALFGVLLVNLTMIDATLYTMENIPFSNLSGMEYISAWAIRLLAQGKFYTIFSFLFGLGFYYFLRKESSDVVLNRFEKRLYALLGLGIIHTIFIWHGDILHVYALAGFFLIKNKNKSDSELIRNMIVLFVFSTTIMVIGSQTGGSEMTVVASDALTAYQQNSYLELLKYRIQNEVPVGLFNLIVVIPKVLVLFYAGYYVGRKGWFDQLDAQRKRIIDYCVISGSLFGFSLVMMLFLSHLDNSIAFKGLIIFEELSTLGGSVFFMTAILLMAQKNKLRKMLMPLRNLGKMALTNYLMQTIFWTSVVNGYGLGYFGKIPYYAYFPLAFGFIMIQILLSSLWLTKFNQGPAEKLWRMAYRDRS
ncbi:MAG: DUF418 domain-containing protein [Clostridiales bacterium]|nr:DUF418 domain-containing protein [Clostridiales bacterium]